jgi:hypothetical protein
MKVVKHVLRMARKLAFQAKNYRAHLRFLLMGGDATYLGELRAVLIRSNGEEINLGLLSRRVVTTAGVNYMRDDFNAATGGADITNFNFHDSGTGVGAEAIGDTTLGTQAGPTTRATGTQSSPASKQYRSIGTIAYTGTLAITEHGLFSQAAQGGTLWDRSVFTAINVVNGDSIQFTYTLTINDNG